MRVKVEVTQADLVDMGVTEEQLEESVRNELSCLEVDGHPLYVNELDVHIEVTDAALARNNG